MSEERQIGDPLKHLTPNCVAVVAAVACAGGRYLVGLRPTEKRHGGMWEFPGGKKSDGESDEQAMARELDEELAVRLGGFGRLMFEVRDPDSPFVIRFFEVELAGKPMALEHAELGWFTPSALARMRLAPADARFVKTVLCASTGQESL